MAQVKLEEHPPDALDLSELTYGPALQLPGCMLKPVPAQRRLRLQTAQRQTIAEQSGADGKGLIDCKSLSASRPQDSHPSQALHHTGDLQETKQQQCPGGTKDDLDNVHNGRRDRNGAAGSSGELRPQGRLTAEEGVLMKKRREKHKPQSSEGPSSGMGFWLQMRQAAGTKVNPTATKDPQPGSEQPPESASGAACAKVPQLGAPLKRGSNEPHAPVPPSAGSAHPKMFKPLQAAPKQFASTGMAAAGQSDQAGSPPDMTRASGLQNRQKQQDFAGANDSIADSDSDSSSRSSQQLLALQDADQPQAVSHVEVCSRC